MTETKSKLIKEYFHKVKQANKEHTNETHNKLARLSEQAHKKAKQYLETNPPQQELSSIHLGRLRVPIKKHFAEEMKEIDKLVKKLVG